MDFMELLDTKLDAIEKVPLPPVGTFRFQVMKLPEKTTSGDGKWDMLTFFCRAVAPTEDVDPTALREYGEVKNIVMRHTFVFDKTDETASLQTANRVKDFLTSHLGIDASLTGKEALNNSVNAQFLGQVKWTPDKRTPGEMQAQFGKTAPVA
jgi:hypothetical protein